MLRQLWMVMESGASIGNDVSPKEMARFHEIYFLEVYKRIQSYKIIHHLHFESLNDSKLLSFGCA